MLSIPRDAIPGISVAFYSIERPAKQSTFHAHIHRYCMEWRRFPILEAGSGSTREEANGASGSVPHHATKINTARALFSKRSGKRSGQYRGFLENTILSLEELFSLFSIRYRHSRVPSWRESKSKNIDRAFMG